MKERKKIKHALWRRPERITRLFLDKDWQSFSTTEKLEPTHSKDLFRKIQVQLAVEGEKARSRKMWRPYWPGIKAIAATFLPLCVSLTLWKLSEKNAAPVHQQQHTSPAQPQWQTSANTSKKRIHLLLPDSSVVFLYPKSSLRYLAEFAGRDRNVYLEGKALFAVKQDKSKAFHVFAGGIKTTALGTSFTINTQNKVNQTLIKLHTGKVLLLPIQGKGSFPKKILLPGQSFIYDRVAAKEIKNGEKIRKVVPKSSYEKIGSILQFKNVNLDKVLDVLGEEYAVSIKIEQANHIKRISYTGEIDLEKENIAYVLQKICLLHELELKGDATVGFIMNRYSNTENQ